jgi:hypothetical protein
MEAARVALDRGFRSGRFCEFPRKTNRLKTVDPLKKRVGPPNCPQLRRRLNSAGRPIARASLTSIAVMTDPAAQQEATSF